MSKDLFSAKDFTTRIRHVRFPESTDNNYYEDVSADGYAFLGAARAICGLPADDCLQKIQALDFTLQTNKEVGGAPVSARNQYLYTLWACFEFADALHSEPLKQTLIQRAIAIGRYPGGMARYCSEEIRLQVPNVTSALALMLILNNPQTDLQELLDVLEAEQMPDGNWNYYSLDAELTPVKITRQEDCYHLAMMYYHLREITSRTGIDTETIRKRILRWLAKPKPRCGSCNTDLNMFLCPGSIGWGVPMTMLAIDGICRDIPSLYTAYLGMLPTLFSDYLYHRNFRVRGLTAWALAKIYQRINGETDAISTLS